MNEWWRASGFVVAGLVVGAVVAALVRRLLDRPHRRPALRQAARPTAALLFWLLVAAGLIAAVASASPETLEPIPSDILSWLPRAGVAGLILIGGYVLGTVASTTVGRTATRATGHRQPLAEASTRAVIVGAASVLALSQLGVDTTILNILIAALAFGIAAALAGIAITGGRDVARSVAAGRSIGDLLEPGDRVTVSSHSGTVERFTVTHLVLTLDDGDTAVVPLSVATAGTILLHRPPPG